MVSRCVAIEVQRNAKWGFLCGKRERARWGEESG